MGEIWYLYLFHILDKIPRVAYDDLPRNLQDKVQVDERRQTLNTGRSAQYL